MILLCENRMEKNTPEQNLHHQGSDSFACLGVAVGCQPFAHLAVVVWTSVGAAGSTWVVWNARMGGWKKGNLFAVVLMLHWSWVRCLLVRGV
jgi:hypothetical protein